MSQRGMSQRVWSRRTAISGAAGATALTALSTSALSTSALGGTAPGGRADAGTKPAEPGAWTANGHLYPIGSGSQRAVVAGVAATLLSWRVDGTELLLTHDPDEVGEGYQGKALLPWPNRIDHGTYSFGGRQLQVPITEPDKQTALHGLMQFVEWQPVLHTRDRVVLEHALPPQYGYPFPMVFRAEFSVDDEGITRTLRAKNAGTTSAPYGTASHTYIAASGDTINPLALRLPARTYYRTNERLIPTGEAPVAGTPYDFRSPRELGPTTMDTAFTDLDRDAAGTATVEFHRPGGHDVQLWMDGTHDYLQVYTDDSPETDRPARQGVTVEPSTCAPNAFVTGDGLVVLRPGEVHESSWGYRITG